MALNATAALTALFVIKPLRRSFILGKEAESANAATDTAKTGNAKTETA